MFSGADIPKTVVFQSKMVIFDFGPSARTRASPAGVRLREFLFHKQLQQARNNLLRKAWGLRQSFSFGGHQGVRVQLIPKC